VVGHIADLAAKIDARFGDHLRRLPSLAGELAYEAQADRLVEIATIFRDDPQLRFAQLMDVCGIDYLDYGRAEWKTMTATRSGFSRGVDRAAPHPLEGKPRFAVAYQLLSIEYNERVSLRVHCPDEDEPIIDSLVGVWPSANWPEREAFDMFGILFRGHPDLRRILTDYGFIGHPFRKDFPLIGHVEVRYDPDKGRVVYEPVSIEPRVLVPRVIRHDNRYAPALTDAPATLVGGAEAPPPAEPPIPAGALSATGAAGGAAPPTAAAMAKPQG
jgi:NADH-quinone oxidoreductase subunit C